MAVPVGGGRDGDLALDDTIRERVAAASFDPVGIRALEDLARHPRRCGRRGERPAAASGGASAFRQGLVSNLLNPKIAVFFTSLLPQFVGPDAGVGVLLLLGALFSAMGVAWLCAYGLAVARGRDLFARPRMRRAIDRVTGAVLVALGLRLAFDEPR